MATPCFRTPAVIGTPIPRRQPTPAFHTADNQADLLPLIRAEKAIRERLREQHKLRRALYAACERAPLGWEARL